MGDGGLAVLQQIVEEPSLWKSHDDYEFAKRHEEYVRVLGAIARIDTDRAADYLQAKAQGCPAKAQGGNPDAMRALAQTGTRGLDRLLALSAQTESYREPWFAPEFRTRKFIPFPKKQQRPTSAACMARTAIAFVSDPAAAPALGKLIDQPELRSAALRALSDMKRPGFETQALHLWQQEASPMALRYLLAVDRTQYLPLLQEKLKALDDEVTRLQRDLADLRARGVRDFVADDSVVRLVFELGGDPSANETLAHYIASRLWVRYQEDTVAYAVMALGLSRAPGSKDALLPLLTDATPLNTWIQMELPFSRYRLDGTGRGAGIPLFVIAAAALKELGDPAVIPQMEQAAAMQDPWFQPLFETVVTALRERRQD